MDTKNYRSQDYVKRLAEDNKRRYINQNPETGAFDTTANKYNIQTLSYPSNTTSLDFPHYVSFFINIRGKSKFNQSNRFNDVAITKPQGAGLTTDEISRATNLAAAGAGGVLGYGAINKMASIRAKNNALQSGATAAEASKAGQDARATGAAKVGGSAAGAILGYGASALAQKFGPDLVKPDQSYRISDVITLHVETPPAVRYSAKWNNTDLGTIVGALGKTSSAEGMMGMGSLAAEGAFAALSAMAKIPQFFAGQPGGGLGGAISSMTKTSINPFREVLFEMMDFRSFTFSYRFLPKSRGEADNIKNIIDTFKFHMHPELSSGNLFFIYPAEFQIVYYFKGSENSYFHKIAPCALTDLGVSYGSGSMSSFHDGIPTEINLSMTFQELEVLTKEKIQLGY